VYGLVPPFTAIVPENPAWSTVQALTLKEPKLIAPSMVTENVAVALTPSESSMVTEPDENVPVELGVPVKEIVLPESAAVSPVGRPLSAMRVYGPVPPLSAIVPENPVWFTVQALTLKEPKLTGGSIVTEKVSLTVAPPESSTVSEPDENVPVEVGVPVKEIVVPESAAVSPVGRPLWAMRL
jgi:hypothetical protein